jgi:hypothetical protein
MKLWYHSVLLGNSKENLVDTVIVHHRPKETRKKNDKPIGDTGNLSEKSVGRYKHMIREK